MKEISRAKKLEVAQYYILGYPYSDIENRAGVSHGSVVNIVKELVIVPYNAIPAKGTWVTLESLIAAIHDLKTEALQGKRLGTLDNIIQRLQQSRGKLIYIALPD